MAKYLLSYDEQDVKNGKLDVSPDGVLKSAGKGGSDDPVLPQKVLFSDYKDYEGHSQAYCCGVPTCNITADEAYELCLATMPFLFLGNGRMVTSVAKTSTWLVAASVYIKEATTSCGSSFEIQNPSADLPNTYERFPLTTFKQS